MSRGRGVCPGGGYTMGPGIPTPTILLRPAKHVRLASGRYASYWNAFLLLHKTNPCSSLLVYKLKVTDYFMVLWFIHTARHQD